MGADIHAYVEFFSKDDFARQGTKCIVHSFSEGEIGFGRNYNLFGLLAGVRSMNSPLYPVRGVPTTPELSYVCSHAYYLKVVENEVVTDRKSPFVVQEYNRRCVSKDEASKMVLDNYHYGAKSTYRDANKSEISDPNWHSATHLTLDELCCVRKQYLLDNIEYESELSRKSKKEVLQFILAKTPRELVNFAFPPHEDSMFYATIRMMLSLESSSGDLETRFVCWFDS